MTTLSASISRCFAFWLILRAWIASHHARSLPLAFVLFPFFPPLAIVVVVILNATTIDDVAAATSCRSARAHSLITILLLLLLWLHSCRSRKTFNKFRGRTTKKKPSNFSPTSGFICFYLLISAAAAVLMYADGNKKKRKLKKKTKRFFLPCAEGKRASSLIHEK